MRNRAYSTSGGIRWPSLPSSLKATVTPLRSLKPLTYHFNAVIKPAWSNSGGCSTYESVRMSFKACSPNVRLSLSLSLSNSSNVEAAFWTWDKFSIIKPILCAVTSCNSRAMRRRSSSCVRSRRPVSSARRCSDSCRSAMARLCLLRLIRRAEIRPACKMIIPTPTVLASNVVMVPEEVLPDAEPSKTNKRMVSDT